MNRVQSPSYRNELKSHSVYIDSYGMTTPGPVQSFAQGIMGRKRASPGLHGEELMSTRKQLSSLADADEEITRTGLSRTTLFPTTADYNDQIATGANIPFDRTALPHVPGFNFPPIVTPRPDLHYGYPRDSFSAHEYGVMQHRRLDPYAHPNSANFWPFFLVEFKSSSRGGTHWVAENQNAGSGSHCVNSIQSLMNYTRGNKRRAMIDSVVFSCVADAGFASIWVHWQGVGDDPRFVSSEVESYRLKRPEDLSKFRSSVRNIIEYGIDERLTTIKNALHDLLPQLLPWDKEDRDAKTRRSFQIDAEDNAAVELRGSGRR